MNEKIKLILAFLLSLLTVYLLMPSYIKLLKKRHIKQSVSEYALDEYKNKDDTPIMGGFLFVTVPLLVCFILDSQIIFNRPALMVMISYAAYCLIGFIDDFLIIILHNNLGLSPKVKLLLQLIFALLIFTFFHQDLNYRIALPFGGYELNLGFILFALFFVFVYAAEANAVNFTDGMDGLCAGVSIIALLPFLVAALMKKEFALALLITAVAGALLAYLKYNFFPARIFMGDSGSLALGAFFAAIAFALDNELLLITAGGVFLLEMLCVCLQLSAVKLFKRRIFRYTPIHYAFVLRGYKEKQVVLFFYLFSLILSGLVILTEVL